MTYRVQKTFNNNVVLCDDHISQTEVILVGKGIGFGKRTGDQFTDFRHVEKRFVLTDAGAQDNLRLLYMTLNENHIGVATEAASDIARSLKMDIPTKKLISVVDHIVFALQRLEDGMTLENPFKDEMRILYGNEWRIAEEAIERMNLALGVTLPEDEIAFLTMHITSILQHNKPTESSREARVLAECVKRIETDFNVQFERHSLAYSRLITHLRFVIQRAATGETILNPMKEQIKEKLPEAYKSAEHVADFLRSHYLFLLTDDEIAFIALHIGRLKEKI
ncbi:MAG: PRD domain-containing protein [Bacilli bacterium]